MHFQLPPPWPPAIQIVGPLRWWASPLIGPVAHCESTSAFWKYDQNIFKHQRLFFQRLLMLMLILIANRWYWYFSWWFHISRKLKKSWRRKGRVKKVEKRKASVKFTSAGCLFNSPASQVAHSCSCSSSFKMTTLMKMLQVKWFFTLYVCIQTLKPWRMQT